MIIQTINYWLMLIPTDSLTNINLSIDFVTNTVAV